MKHNHLTTILLATYSWAMNVIAFLIWMIAVYLTVRSILRLGKEVPGKQLRSARKRFVELEKDYKWRRLKMVYLVWGLLVMFVVIAATYQPGEQAPLQTLSDYKLEEAQARFDTIMNLLLTTLVLWGVYRFLLPKFYEYYRGLRAYLKAPGKSS